MKQTLVVLALALAIVSNAPVMAQTNNTNDHWSTFDQCNAAVSAGTATPYTPGISNPQKPDVAKGEKLVTSPTGWCNRENSKYGLFWVYYTAEDSLLQRGDKFFDPRCNNGVEEIRQVEVVAHKETKADKPADNSELSELSARIKTDLVRIETAKEQQSGPGNCVMVLEAQRQQYSGDSRKKSVAINCEDHDGKIVVTASDFPPVKPAGNCGFLCRFFTEPAMIPGHYVSGGGYGYNTYYGGYNRSWHGSHPRPQPVVTGVPPSGSTGPVLGGSGTAPGGNTGSNGGSGNTGRAFTTSSARGGGHR